LDGQVKEFEVTGPCYVLLEYDDDSMQICFLDLKEKGHEEGLITGGRILLNFEVGY
jgi:hypothetical protein